MKERFDTVLMGINIGVIAPIIGACLYYLVYVSRFPGTTFDEYTEFIIDYTVLPAVLSLAALVNLALFFLFLKFNIEKGARGILASTIFYGFIIIILKLTN